MHRRDLAHTFRPVPMRQNMGHRQLGSPPGLINVEPILLKAAKIEDAEIGTARGHFDLVELFEFRSHPRLLCRVGEVQEVRNIAPIGSWFPQIVETSPNELTSSKGKLVLTAKLGIRWSRPTRRIKVV